MPAVDDDPTALKIALTARSRSRWSLSST